VIKEKTTIEKTIFGVGKKTLDKCMIETRSLGD
jgi:hypothetical protein